MSNKCSIKRLDYVNYVVKDLNEDIKYDSSNILKTQHIKIERALEKAGITHYDGVDSQGVDFSGENLYELSKKLPITSVYEIIKNVNSKYGENVLQLEKTTDRDLLRLDVSALLPQAEEQSTRSKNKINPESIREAIRKDKKDTMMSAIKNNKTFNDSKITDESIANNFIITLIEKFSNKFGTNVSLVTEEEAISIISSTPQTYNGENAFIVNDNIYFVKGKLTLNSVVHEFSHPLIHAVKQDNPKLFDKLYSDFTSTPEGSNTREEIDSNNPTASEEIKQIETLVKFLEIEGVKAVKSKESSSLLSRVYYAIKQALRKLFKAKIDVSTLNSTTTLKQLSDMMLNDEFNPISELESIRNNALFIRDKEQSIRDFNKQSIELKQAVINDIYKLASNHIANFKNNEDFENLAEELTSDHGLYNIIKGSLQSGQNVNITSRDVKEKLEEDRLRGVDFVNAIYSLGSILTVIKEDIVKKVKELETDTALHKTAKDVFQYETLMNEWESLLQRIKNDLIDTNNTLKFENIDSELLSIIDKNINSINAIKSEIQPIYKNNSVNIIYDSSQLFNQTQISNNRKQVEKIEKQLEKLDPSSKKYKNLSKKIEVLEKRLNVDLITKEKIKDVIEGKEGGVNAFNSLLESHVLNTDPIIGGAVNLIKTTLDKIKNESLLRSQEFQHELAKLVKDAGLNPKNITEFASNFIIKNDIGVYIKDPETGERVFNTEEVFSFIGPYKDYKLKFATLNDEIKNAKEEGNENKLLNLLKDREDLNKKHMHRPFISEVYEPLENLLSYEEIKTDDDGNEVKVFLGRIAREETTNIIKQISDLNASPADRGNEVDVDEQIDLLWKDYSGLFSRVDKDGNKKTGDDLKKAELLIKFREEDNKYKKWVLTPNAFEESLRKYEDYLAELHGDRKSLDYIKDRQEWIDKNTNYSLTEEYYEEKSKIIENIQEILGENENIKEAYEELFELLKTLDKTNNETDLSNISENALKRLKELEERIVYLQSQGNPNIEDLDKEDIARLNVEFSSLKELSTRQVNNNYKAAAEKITSNLSFSKIIDEDPVRSNEIKKSILKTLINQGSHVIDKDLKINRYLKEAYNNPNNSDFKEWFDANHLMKKDKRTGGDYKPLLGWTRIVPENPEHVSKIIIKDIDGNISDIILGKPTIKYYKKVVKEGDTMPDGSWKNFKTEKIYQTGNREADKLATVDAKGRWLPKRSPGIANPFINEAYEDLYNSNPKVFKILEHLTKYHLENQKGLNNSAKLGLELPRYRVELKQISEELEFNKVFREFKDDFKKRSDNALESINYNKEEALLRGDMDANSETGYHEGFINREVERIPISGLFNLKTEDVSLNIVKSLNQYMLSSKKNKEYGKKLPILEGLNRVLKEVEKDSITDSERNTFQKIKEGIKVTIKQSTSRQVALQNVIDRELYGKINKGVDQGFNDNAALNQTLKMLKSAAGHQFFAVNLPSAIKNRGGAMFHVFIEALGAEYFNIIDWQAGRKFSFSMMAKLQNRGAKAGDIYQIGEQSLEHQIMLAFDPADSRLEDKLGESFGRSALSDAIGFTWLKSPRAFLDLEVGARVLGAYLHSKKARVPQKVMGGGVKYITYTEAFTLRNGTLKLKPGIDPKYDVNGSEFMKHKALARSILHRTTGDYSSFGKSELERYALFRAFMFIKRYYTRMAVNHYGFSISEAPKGIINKINPKNWEGRVNMNTGEKRMGSLPGTLKLVTETLTDADKLRSLLSPYSFFKNLSRHERSNFIKAIMHMVTIKILSSIIIKYLLGFDDEDDEKWDKLKLRQNKDGYAEDTGLSPFGIFVDDEMEEVDFGGWLKNHALLAAMSTREEAETFIPFQGNAFGSLLGMLETGTVLTPLKDIRSVYNNLDKEYQQDTGVLTFKQDGSNKAVADIFRMIGVKGTTFNPIEGIKTKQSNRDNPRR